MSVPPEDTASVKTGLACPDPTDFIDSRFGMLGVAMPGCKDVSQRWHENVPSSCSQRVLAFFIVVFPIIAIGVVVALGIAEPRPIDLALMVTGFALTGLGISVGFHRYFTHRSFDTGPAIAFVLGMLGSMAWQGPAIEWAEVHRRHHRHSDRPDDPHSPHQAGSGLLGIVRGAIFAHLGWMFLVNIRAPDMARYSPDLRADPIVRLISRLHYLFAAAGLILPGCLAYLVVPTWQSACMGAFWGGLVRAFALNHVTWCVNSVCHIWGKQDFNTGDHSRNNPVFGLIALGEGWHNNHHAFPSSARFGLRWWQLDAGYATITLLRKLGWVWNVRTPNSNRERTKRVPRAVNVASHS